MQSTTQSLSQSARRNSEAAVLTRERRTVDLSLLAVACAYVLSALVGLPLFQDGGSYFFVIATSGTPEIPNLRFAAVLPQLPAVWAEPVLDDPVLLRHLFSLSYIALPLGSLLACWLLVRRQAPALVLFPLLWFLLNLLNFSGVSELLTSLYLSWPLVLAMLLVPERRWVWVYATLAAVILALLHPLAFLPASALALLAAALSWTLPQLRRVWGRLALLLLASGLVRLIWTVLGANAYERGRLQGDAAVSYLMTATPSQHLLLAVVMVLGALVTVSLLLRDGRGRRWLIRSALWMVWLPPLAVALISSEFLNGVGIQLKSGLSFAAGLVLMGLASLVMLLRRPLRIDSEPTAGRMSENRLQVASLVVASMTALLLVKSAAWWTATRGLQNLLAESEASCIRMSAEQPFALQWPWMRIQDDWATPMNALAFRPRLILDPERGVEPVPLILRGDGCERLRASGKFTPTDWIARDLTLVEGRFGPLREQR
jgi:hypothetical protein